MTSFADRGRGADGYQPPKGNYRVTIRRAWAGYNNGGKEKATIGLEIMDGAERGNEFVHWMDLEGGYNFAERSLTMYGLPISVLEVDDDNLERSQALERLKRDLQQLIGVVAWVTVSYNDRGYNVTVDSAQTQISDVTPAAPAASGFEAAVAAARADDLEPAPWD